MQNIELDLLEKISEHQSYRDLKFRHEDLESKISDLKREKRFYEKIIKKSEVNVNSEEVADMKKKHLKMTEEVKNSNKKLKSVNYRNLIFGKKVKINKKYYDVILKAYRNICKTYKIKDNFDPYNQKFEEEDELNEDQIKKIKEKMDKTSNNLLSKFNEIKNLENLIRLNKKYMRERDIFLDAEYVKIMKFKNKNFEPTSKNKIINSFKVTNSSFSGLSGSKSHSRLGSTLFKLSKPGKKDKSSSIRHIRSPSSEKFKLPRIYSLNEHEHQRSQTMESKSPAVRNSQNLNYSSFKIKNSVKNLKTENSQENRNSSHHRRIKSNPGYSKEVLENIIKKRSKDVRNRSRDSLKESIKNISLKPMRNSVKQKKRISIRPPLSNMKKKRKNSNSRKKTNISLNLKNYKTDVKKREESKILKKEYEESLREGSLKEMELIQNDTSLLKKKVEKKLNDSPLTKKKLIRAVGAKKKKTEKIKESSFKSKDDEEESSFLEENLKKRMSHFTIEGMNYLKSESTNSKTSRNHEKKLSTIYSRNELSEKSTRYNFIELKPSGSLLSVNNFSPDAKKRDSNLEPAKMSYLKVRSTLEKPSINIKTPRTVEKEIQKNKLKLNISKSSDRSKVENSPSKISDKSKVIKKILIVETPDSSVVKPYNQNSEAFHESQDSVTESYTNFIKGKKDNVIEKESNINRQTSIVKHLEQEKKFNFISIEKTKEKISVSEKELSVKKYKWEKRKSHFRRKSKSKEIDIYPVISKSHRGPNEKKELRSILSNAQNTPRKLLSKKGTKGTVTFRESETVASGDLNDLKKSTSLAKALQQKNFKKSFTEKKSLDSQKFAKTEKLGDSENFLSSKNLTSDGHLSSGGKSLKSKKTIMRILSKRSMVFKNMERSEQDIYNPREGLKTRLESKVMKNIDGDSANANNEFNLQMVIFSFFFN